MKCNPIVLLSLVLMLIMGLDATAQYKKRYRRSGTQFDVRYGIKVGYQLSNFAGDEFLVEYNNDNILVYPAVSYSSLTGYHAGAYLDIRVNELFIIQPEVQYTRMGSEMLRRADLLNVENNYIVDENSNPNNMVDVVIQRRLSYLHIPIAVKIGLSRLIHLNVGPQFGFKISEGDAYGDVDNNVIEQLNITDPLAPSPYKSIDYGAIAGLSFQSEKGFVFNVRYNRNFNNIQVNDGLTILAKEPKNYNTAVLFSLGYTFKYEDRLRENIGRRH
jgi:hypothetical protein